MPHDRLAFCTRRPHCGLEKTNIENSEPHPKHTAKNMDNP
jgi:hypothetical protein